MAKINAAKVNEVKEWVGTGTLNFFGMPFAGKDSQAKRLARLFGVKHLSSGEVLRSSDMPAEARQAMDRGELVATEVYRDAVLPFLGSAAFAGQPLILSSVGRMKGEEFGVIEATEAAGHPIRAVPFLGITEEEAYRRLSETSRGRADDTPESLSKRLQEFEEKTRPVVQTYYEMGLLLYVDAMDAQALVFRNLINFLHERAMAA